MPTLTLTANLSHRIPRETRTVQGSTVRESLLEICREAPFLQGDLIDDQGRLRKHLAIFVDGELRPDGLDFPLSESSDVYIMQALSGG